MNKFIIFLAVILIAFCGGGKEKEHSHEAQGEQAQAYTHEQEGLEHKHAELHVTLAQQKEWGIVTGRAQKQNIASRFSLPGTLALNQNKTAHISSFVDGQVDFLSVDLGSKVKKGQPLITINSPGFAQAQADFLRARAKFILSQKEYERAKMLRKEKAIEEKEYLRREVEYQKNTTEYGVLGSKLHTFGITHKQIDALIKKCTDIEDEEYKCDIVDSILPLLSPINGTVIFRDIILGEHVEPNKILFTVSDLSMLWVMLDAYEKDIPFISKKSNIVIKSVLYPDKEFPGKITYISDVIDEKLRTIKIRVEVSDLEGLLKSNMYVRGYIENEAEGKEILAVPEDAVQIIDGEKSVFVLENDNIFAVRHVSIGEKIGNFRIITSGLEEGEKLVVEGAFSLKAELSKATSGDTHVH